MARARLTRPSPPAASRLMPIADIVVGRRHRKDMGDIEGLARSIADLGLLQPIVVSEEGLLLAGERRLRACLILGWSDIPVMRVPA
jgi:ParB family chromosome partitioning protein